MRRSRTSITCWYFSLAFACAAHAQSPAAIADALEASWRDIPGLRVEFDLSMRYLSRTSWHFAVYLGPVSGSYVHAYDGVSRYRWERYQGQLLGSYMAFDGKTYFQGYEGATAVTGSVEAFQTRRRKSYMGDYYGYYFECLGTPPYDGPSLTVRRMGSRHSAATAASTRPFSLIDALRKGTYTVVKREPIDGALCTKLTAPGDEIWLDQTRGWALVRRRWYWGDTSQPMLDLSLANWHKAATNVFLPYAITRSDYDPPNPGVKESVARPAVETKIVVQRHEVGPFGQARFQVIPASGTLVDDDTLKSSPDGKPVPISYRFGQSPEATDAMLADKLRTWRAAEQAKNFPWAYLACINVAFVVAIVVFWWRRRASVSPAD